MTMDLDSRLSIPASVISRGVVDETVLLDLERGIYFGLDGVGQRIWESIAAGLTLGDTAAMIVSEYDVDTEKAQSDVLEFARELVERGLLAE